MGLGLGFSRDSGLRNYLTWQRFLQARSGQTAKYKQERAMLTGVRRNSVAIRAGQTNWIWQRIVNHPRPRLANAYVMIVNPFDDAQRFTRSHMGKVLLWGLKRRRIDWMLRNPTCQRLIPERFDAVLCWPYGFRESPGFLEGCVELEERARDSGIPVINSLAGCDMGHSWCLRLWREAGIECPDYQLISRWKDIHLNYPLILRTDSLHLGLNMQLAVDAKEAKSIMRRKISPSLDMAIEFVDTMCRDSCYRKWRSHVIGDRVIPRQVQLSRSWKVNLDAAECCPESAAENQTFIAGGEPEEELVAFAARALNAEIIALDYSKKPDGSYIFWEGNRNFDLSIDGEMWRQYQCTTGLSQEDCVQGVRAIGDAIADLIINCAQSY
jgi:hypothetical protein